MQINFDIIEILKHLYNIDDLQAYILELFYDLSEDFYTELEDLGDEEEVRDE